MHSLNIFILQQAEDYGYNPAQVRVALAQDHAHRPVEWLHNNWAGMLQAVCKGVHYGQEMLPVGEERAVRALVEHSGDVKKAVVDCEHEWKEKVIEVLSFMILN